MKNKLLKKIVATAASVMMILNVLPVFAEGEEVTTVNEVLPATNTVCILDKLKSQNIDYNWQNGIDGIQFGKTSINLIRNDVYLWFELHDIDAIETLSLKLNLGTSSTGRPDKLVAYTVADKLPEVGSIAHYGMDTQTYTEWKDYVANKLTALANEDIIQFVPQDSTTYSEMDITSLISAAKAANKDYGYLLIQLKNGNNTVNNFADSSLTVTYNSEKLETNRTGYLTALNEAMDANAIKAAAEGSSGMYFDVDSEALADMTGVYTAIFENMPVEGYTKDSFKTAFDAKVNEYVETKEFTGNYFVSYPNNITDFTFAVNNIVTAMRNSLVGFKIDDTYAVKNIELSLIPTGDNRPIYVTNAYMLDEINTGEKATYTAADDSENDIYKFWHGLSTDFEKASVIGMGKNVGPNVSGAKDTRSEGDLTDYTKYTLNKYGKEKYMFLRLYGGQNVNFYTGNADITQAIKVIVKYDKTAMDSQKKAGWDAIYNAMEASEVKAAIEAYSEGMGLDYITNISKDYIYEDLLNAIGECSDLTDFCEKAQEIYAKYVSVKNILPCEEIMYNTNWMQIQPMDGGVAAGKRFVGQYNASDLGNGNNIINADFTITTSEDNAYANSMFVRTIKPIAFEGFDPSQSYYVDSTTNENNEAAAAGTDATLLGNQWKYIENAKAVSRITFSAGAATLKSDVTDSLKEKLANGDTKVAYTLGVEEQNGSAKLAKINDKYSAIKVTFDRTANEDAALAALANAATASDVLDAIKAYSIEFNVSDAELAKIDAVSTAAGNELLNTFKEGTYANIIEAGESFDALIANIQDTMIKFEITDSSYADGVVKANIKKLSKYTGDMKVIFVSYKNGVMKKLVLADDTAIANLQNLEKDATAEVSVTADMGDYDTLKVMILDSFSSLEPLAYVK